MSESNRKVIINLSNVEAQAAIARGRGEEVSPILRVLPSAYQSPEERIRRLVDDVLDITAELSIDSSQMIADNVQEAAERQMNNKLSSSAPPTDSTLDL